jgi:hypothetical protein
MGCSPERSGAAARVYEIRRDLEHEDDEYEAGAENCFYVFKACIEAVLSQDPATLLRVARGEGDRRGAQPGRARR